MKKNLLLIPITLTTLTPMISMVGCGDPDTPEHYVINYGDDVNCGDETQENYHTIDEVKEAIKDKAKKEKAGTIITTEQLNELNNNTFTEENLYNLYFDIIATCVFIKNKPVLITNWKVDLSQNILNFTYSLKEMNIVSTLYNVKSNPHVSLSLKRSDDVIYKIGDSYRFYDCVRG